MKAETIWPWCGGDLAPVDAQLVLDHNDPFNCECRAFARLKEVRRPDLAVGCHGYVFIDQANEELVRRDFSIDDWDRSPADEGKPIRAIVKDLIRAEEPFDPPMVLRMMEALALFNSIGIRVRDVKIDMYRDGTVVDLSQAMTVPHFRLDWKGGLWTRDQILK